MTLQSRRRPAKFKWFFLLLAVLLPLGEQRISWSKEYIIGVGDILHISVLDNNELESVVTVRPDTQITFPLIGDIQAAGLTAPELARRITDMLAAKVRNPTVTVSLREIGSYRVYVLGKATKSGVYYSRSELTLLQALAMAGGIAEGTDLSSAYIVRGTQRIPVNLIKLLREVDTAHNPALMPEDIIVLPDTPKLKNLIVVMGEVNKPGVYALNQDEEMSTVQAIALAGGFTPFASQSRVTVIRDDGTKKSTIRVDVKDLLKYPESAKGLVLRPGDTVVVP
jgi:polysaccharide export outer membrane protein